VIVLEVAAALDGERVDRLVAMLTDLSRARAAELVDSGAVHLDGTAVTTRSTRVRTGQELTVAWSGEPGPPGPAADPGLARAVLDPATIHVDEHVIVVDKPSGLVVHPGAGAPDGTLVNALLARYPELAGVGDPARPGIVHRLDRGTSGLMVVARSTAAYEALVDQLADHRVNREYRTLVHGVVEAAAGLVDAPIGRSSHDPTRRAVRQDGRPARTRYDVLERFTAAGPATLLRCRLETGRTHQIRVHLQAIGHPVVGDDRYGGREPAGVALGRPFLHAAALAFEHPDGQGPVSYSSPLPADLAEALAECR
jgi:23S rRNA pseudouridine1911/1915/1917 synthase